MRKYQKVLLIDDNETVNYFNEDLLAETELFETIEIIDNGTEALEYLLELINSRKELPELILLDIKMPDYDGFEILEEVEEMLSSIDKEDKYLLKAKKSVVCILTTSQHSRDLEAFSKYQLAKEFIEKPLSASKIKDIVNKYLMV